MSRCENFDVSHDVPLFQQRTSYPVFDTMVLIVRPRVANVLCGTVTLDQVTPAPQLPLFEAQPKLISDVDLCEDSDWEDLHVCEESGSIDDVKEPGHVGHPSGAADVYLGGKQGTGGLCQTVRYMAEPTLLVVCRS